MCPFIVWNQFSSVQQIGAQALRLTDSYCMSYLCGSLGPKVQLHAETLQKHDDPGIENLSFSFGPEVT